MKRFITTLFFFAAIVTGVQGNTAPQNNTAGDLATGSPVVIELGYKTIRAGLAGANTPNVVFSASINWDENSKLSKSNLESVFTQVFNQLNVSPANHPVLVSEAFLSAQANREVLADVLMGTLKVPAMYIAKANMLALYATGKTTGFVVRVQPGNTSNGTDVIEMTSIVDGFVNPVGSQTLINASSIHVLTEGEMPQKFQDDLIGRVDTGNRKPIANHIVLAGHDPQIPGIASELEAKIAYVLPPNYDVNVIVPPDYTILVWKGGKMLASQSYFSQLCFTQADYAKDGAKGVYKKIL